MLHLRMETFGRGYHKGPIETVIGAQKLAPQKQGSVLRTFSLELFKVFRQTPASCRNNISHLNH